jgi:hypothetical protein
MPTTSIKPYFEFKKPKMLEIPGDLSLDQNGAAIPGFGGYSANAVSLGLSFEGITQYDGALFGRNFIRPIRWARSARRNIWKLRTAATGSSTRQPAPAFPSFRTWPGGPRGSDGHERRFARHVQRGSGSLDRHRVRRKRQGYQIAVSDTSNALGGGSRPSSRVRPLGFGRDCRLSDACARQDAVYIGTNNFAPASAGGANSFRGTTLNVIPLDSLFQCGLTDHNEHQAVSSRPTPGALRIGVFAIQGVNSSAAGSTGGQCARCSISTIWPTR